jgi:hypothetical protein
MKAALEKLLDIGLNANPIAVLLWVFGVRKVVESWIIENISSHEDSDN